MHTNTENETPVITIGSGNIEYILEHDGEIQLGHKHVVKTHEFMGGSCVNYSYRLITAGKSVFPIPFIGNDQLGYEIQNKIVSIGLDKKISEKAIKFINSDFFFPDIQTPKATIIVHKGRRTIFSQGLTRIKITEKHIQDRIDYLKDLIPDHIGSVMIGHITVDDDIQKPGLISKKIINSYYDKFLIFANFGNSQLKHGVNFWKEDLCHTDIFQLNLQEIRRLFRQGDRNISLYDIVEWLRAHSITAVITLNRFGAIGTYKDGKEGIILAWPLNIGKIVDPTGAGDAFASGMISILNGKKDFTFEEFLSAINTGRTWASHACTTLGASGSCPDQEILNEYDKQISKSSNRLIEVTKVSYAEQIMDLIDKAY